MDKPALKDLMYGGIAELMNNRKYYYASITSPSFSHWTDDGKEALAEFMNIMCYKMLESEIIELDRRAKDMVIKNLKGDNN
jgi:hypothetical protein